MARRGRVACVFVPIHEVHGNPMKARIQWAVGALLFLLLVPTTGRSQSGPSLLI
jgi:hypothetical protein